MVKILATMMRMTIPMTQDMAQALRHTQITGTVFALMATIMMTMILMTRLRHSFLHKVPGVVRPGQGSLLARPAGHHAQQSDHDDDDDDHCNNDDEYNNFA